MSSSEEENEFDDSNDDSSEEDIPLSGLAKKSKKGEESAGRKRRSSSSKVSYAEDDDEEEEEDDESVSDDEDVPLSSLKGKSKSPKKAPAKKKTPAKKAPAKKKAKTTPAKSSSSTASSSKYASASSALYGSECDKGLLIQRFLCRWWYAITWPDPSKLPEKPPQNCDALDGFPGVYVCTSGDDVGRIVDLRNKDEAPSFDNLAKKSSEQLQELLIKAVEEQKQQLIDVEGKGTEAEKGLNNILKWARKVRSKTADKNAEKVLKKGKLTLK
jgi:hypothetical protein